MRGIDPQGRGQNRGAVRSCQHSSRRIGHGLPRRRDVTPPVVTRDESHLDVPAALGLLAAQAQPPAPAGAAKEPTSQDALRTWLTTFAGMLTGAGLTGVLRAAPPTRRP